MRWCDSIRARKSSTLSTRINTTGRGPGKPTRLLHGPSSEITTTKQLGARRGRIRRWLIRQAIYRRPAGHVKNSRSKRKKIQTFLTVPIHNAEPWTKKETLEPESLPPPDVG